jgi:disulfide bond formation protein DsbB
VATGAILAALGFQHIGGYIPCPLCLQQRYAYYLAIPAALIVIFLAGSQPGLARLIVLVIAAAFLLNAGLGVYHSGAEWGWWPGPQSCASGVRVDLSKGNLTEELRKARVIRCDEAPWRFLWLSFAGWNAVISAALTGLALFASRNLSPRT